MILVNSKIFELVIKKWSLTSNGPDIHILIPNTYNFPEKVWNVTFTVSLNLGVEFQVPFPQALHEGSWVMMMMMTMMIGESALSWSQPPLLGRPAPYRAPSYIDLLLSFDRGGSFLLRWLYFTLLYLGYYRAPSYIDFLLSFDRGILYKECLMTDMCMTCYKRLRPVGLN